MATQDQKSDHITKVRDAARKLIEVHNLINELKAEYVALQLNTLTDADMVGDNAGLTAVQIGDVYTALDADTNGLNAHFSAGWAAVYYRLI